MGKQTGNPLIRSLHALMFLIPALTSIAMLAPTAPSQASEVDSFRLNQVCAIDPDFNAFVEILDVNGNMIDNVQKAQLSAVLGSQPLTIDEVMDFGKTGQGMAYILLVDVSRSLTEKEFASMRQVLQTWIDGMGPKDQTAIITFGSEVKTLQDFSNDKALLKTLIKRLKPTDNDTQLHAGIARALELGSRANASLPARRVIITLSDGQDDFAGGMTKDEVLERMKVDPVPIYAIGYYQTPRKLQKEEGLKNLGAFARSSGGTYFRAESNTIPLIFSQIQQRIKNVYQVKLTCRDCMWDGSLHHLQMTFTQKPKILSAGLDMRLLTGTGDPNGGKILADVRNKMYPWGYVGAGLLLLGLIAASIIMAVRKREDVPPPNAFLAEGGPERDDTNPYQTVQLNDRNTIPLRAGSVPPGKPKTPGKLLRLTVVRGEPGRPDFEVNLNDRLVIGRAPNCDIALTEDKEVSRNHCEMTLEDGKIKIADLNSKNGTLVNGVPITGTYQLQADDLILVGKTELRLSIL